MWHEGRTKAAAAELLGASAARHGVEARPWLLRPPHAAPHERNAVLRACDRNAKRALAAKLGTDEKYGEARAALAPALRVAYERHGVLSKHNDPKHWALREDNGQIMIRWGAAAHGDGKAGAHVSCVGCLSIRKKAPTMPQGFYRHARTQPLWDHDGRH